jgi:hypothetical protein
MPILPGSMAAPGSTAKAFSSEVDAGSREENASEEGSNTA